MAKTTISAKIDPDRLARLDARVAELGISRTSAIEAAVDAWLEPAGVTVTCVSNASVPTEVDLDRAAAAVVQPTSNPWGI